MKHELFIEELAILDNSKKVVTEHKNGQEELLREYETLLHHYEKLLKTSKKTYRISDLLNNMLQKKEAEIQKVNENLRIAQESRKNLISDITHEMGAPIVGIQNYLKAMLEKRVETNDENLAMIYDNVLVVNHLIHDLFELSVLETNKSSVIMTEVSLIDITDIILGFKLEVEERGFIFQHQLVTETESIIVYIDKMKIKQVLTNIMYNAMKHTPAGGVIRIEMEWKTSDETSSHKSLMIRITDSGSGIHEHVLPYVFDRFYKGENGGTGLGLAIAKEIIEIHQGEIGVISRVNKGSTFYFTIPVKG